MGLTRPRPVDLQFVTEKSVETGEVLKTVRKRVTGTIVGPAGQPELQYETFMVETSWYERDVSGAAVLMLSDGQIYLRPLDKNEPAIRVKDLPAKDLKEYADRPVHFSGTLHYLRGSNSMLPNTWRKGEPTLSVSELTRLRPLVNVFGMPLLGVYRTVAD